MKHFVAQHHDEKYEVGVCSEERGVVRFYLGKDERVANVTRLGDLHYSVICGDQSHDLRYFRKGNSWKCYFDGQPVDFEMWSEAELRRRATQGDSANASGKLVSPMPGKVVAIKVKVGQKVSRGEGVMVVEAMKMQNEFKSAIDGVVEKIHVTEGDSVEGGAVLLIVEAL